jgi:sugar/nucleoside kinase (ribokinase family)
MRDSVLAIGGATWDVLFTTPEAKLLGDKRSSQRLLAFPYGSKVDAHGVSYGFGGGAANVAVALARLGVKTGIATRVGGDWRGQEVIKNLRAHKVATSLVQLDSTQTTPLAFIVTTGGAHDHVAFVSRGASVNFSLPRVVPAAYSWVYLTSLATPRWQVELRALFAHLKQSRSQVFWNPGIAQLAAGRKLKPLLQYVSILDLNHEEAQVLARDMRLTYTNIGSLLRSLQALGPRAVLITDGANGAYYYDGEQVLHCPALKVKPVNTTGAGDAFGAGFLAGYLHSRGDVRVALDWGMYSSSSVITHVGAQRGLLTRAKLNAFSKRHV